MTTTPLSDPVLARFRAALDVMYGSQIDRVILFGSRARGEATAESDYDVAIFLRSMDDHWKELDRLAELRVEFLGGGFFDAFPFVAEAYAEMTPLMREIRRDGIEV